MVCRGLSRACKNIFRILYYFPVLEFPYIPEHSYLVDEHIIYALAFLSLAALRAGSVWGMGGSISNLPMCARFPTLKKFLE
ncbi:MAG: hypothetical protein UY07_C0021G0025 [Parcubacteria group bacterium GW2011_GWA1_47_8]|nr:MAG: hypothetical protein UY07_C0021G0025 [Parcubacteria group bacterium GW2011_GWA1_47_8]